MADITQNSYAEASSFFKVLFQRGRDIRDCELNEFQDIIRVLLYRSMTNGVQKTKLNTMNPGSNDDGYLVVGTGAANAVTLKAGWLHCDGIPVRLAADTTFSGFTTAGAPRTDTVYLAITEAEVADPSAVAQLGETTKRRQIQVTVSVSETGPAGVPANTAAEIWEGGIHYFQIANIARGAGVAAIAAIDVTDTRNPLPPTYIERLRSVTYPGDSVVGTAAKAVSFAGSHASLAGATVMAQITELLAYINQPDRVRTIAANVVADDAGYRDETVILNATNISYTLPAPASSAGREIFFADKTGTLAMAGTAQVTLVRNGGGDKIDGIAADYLLQTPYGRWSVRCDGTDWYVFCC